MESVSTDLSTTPVSLRRVDGESGVASQTAMAVLLVDDEPDIGLAVGDALRDAGCRVVVATNGAEALDLITTQPFDVMICDIRLPKLDGLTLFRRTRQESPDTTVILMTAFGAVQDAVAAVKEGAHDYLTKPFDIDEITLRVQRIAEHRSLLRELDDARAQLASRQEGETIVGRSIQMLRLLDRVNTIATSHAPVLLQGESGTGKELVARALHDSGPAPRQTVRRGELRRLPGDAARGRAVRPRTRRLHRRRSAPRGRFGPRTPAPCSWTRSRRCRCPRRPSCCASCRKGRSSRSGPTSRCGRRPRHLGHPPGPARADRERHIPRGPLLPTERPRRRHPAAARAQGGPPPLRPVPSRS